MFGTGGDANARLELVALKQRILTDVHALADLADRLETMESESERRVAAEYLRTLVRKLRDKVR